jgi:hypothetical protein
VTTPPAPTTSPTGAPGAPPAAAPTPGARARPALSWPLLALVALCLGTLVATLVYPTYSNYDSMYSLVWGRELLDGQLPSFEAYRAPTQHPLAVLFGALLALLGYGGDRLLVLATLASFVVLAVVLYQLGRTAFTALVGLIAAVILCTRFDFPFLAARGYLDIPYLALVLWAALLEARRSRRGRPVLVLLLLAGLLRPEAWLLSGLYWLWLFPKATWRERAVDALLVGAAPLIWVATDFVVTGDPLYSHTHTSGLAEELGRQKGLAEVPGAMMSFLKSLVKFPVAVAGAIGLALAVWLVPARTRVPLALLVAGLGTFLLVGAAGLSVINRYLLVPSLMVMLFAAFAVGGFTVLEDGRLRRAWTWLAIAAVAFAGVWTLLRVDLNRLSGELTFRGDSRAALKSLLEDPNVRAAAACGPITTPNHKLVPDVRWILDLPEERVIARSDRASAAGVDTGVALHAARRSVLLRQGFNPDDDSAQDTLLNVPPPGFTRIAGNAFYAAYARCA